MVRNVIAEYIEREAALALVRPDAPEDEEAAVTIATAKKLVRSIILRTPAADVAPVVRCEDCLFWEFGENECESWQWCKALHRDMPPHAFCSLGERKDEERNER